MLPPWSFGAFTPSVNFAYLAAEDPLVAALGAQAERCYLDDPNTALIKLQLVHKAAGWYFLSFGRLRGFQLPPFPEVAETGLAEIEREVAAVGETSPPGPLSLKEEGEMSLAEIERQLAELEQQESLLKAALKGKG